MAIVSREYVGEGQWREVDPETRMLIGVKADAIVSAEYPVALLENEDGAIVTLAVFAYGILGDVLIDQLLARQPDRRIFLVALPEGA
jgi:hypothetical protein